MEFENKSVNQNLAWVCQMIKNRLKTNSSSQQAFTQIRSSELLVNKVYRIFESLVALLKRRVSLWSTHRARNVKIFERGISGL